MHVFIALTGVAAILFAFPALIQYLLVLHHLLQALQAGGTAGLKIRR